MQETAVSILCMDRQRFSMHSRTCHSCTISRPHFDIEPLLCGYKTRWSAFLRLVSCQISGYTKCGSDGISCSYTSFVTALCPHLSGQLLPRRFELESVDARQLLPDEWNILFVCDQHPLVCVSGVFPLIPAYYLSSSQRNGVLTDDIISMQEWLTVVHIVSL